MALATAQRLEVDEWTVRCRICSSGNDDEHLIQYHAQRINFLLEIEKRLDINHTIYPGSGNNSQFVFDGLGHIVKIVETVSGSVTSTKQFVQDDGDMQEARDASGNLLSQYFSLGQFGSSNSYFYQLNHRADVVGVTNNSGSQIAAIAYDAYGRPTVLSGTFTSDFGFTGLYLHQRSGLNLAVYRAYNPTLGRWINRDPIGENNGVNIYSYVLNAPSRNIDPTGLGPIWAAVGIAIGGEVGTWAGGLGGFGATLPVGGAGAFAGAGLGGFLGAGLGGGLGGLIPDPVIIPSIFPFPPQRRPKDKPPSFCPAKGRNPLPSRGEPGSSGVFDPGDGTGTIRDYDDKGQAKTDYDFGHDHGAGDPHAHDWDWTGTKPIRGPGRPLNAGE